jgi:hypothetical protein
MHLQTIYTQTQYKPTAWIGYVRSVAIANATNTITTASLLFLLSVQFIVLYFGFQLTSGGGCVPLPPVTLFSHLHVVISKYLKDL